jgi:putative flippase GtrA
MPAFTPRALAARFATFLRSAVTGGAATLADLAVIAFAVGVLHASPAAANVPALLVGAVIQFFGNRSFAFRAQGGAAGALHRQAALFALTEAVTMVLNGALYHAVATHLVLSATGAVVARAITTNLVFVGWSYPVWKRVFAPATAAAAT